MWPRPHQVFGIADFQSLARWICPPAEAMVEPAAGLMSNLTGLDDEEITPPPALSEGRARVAPVRARAAGDFRTHETTLWTRASIGGRAEPSARGPRPPRISRSQAFESAESMPGRARNPHILRGHGSTPAQDRAGTGRRPDCPDVVRRPDIASHHLPGRHRDRSLRILRDSQGELVGSAACQVRSITLRTMAGQCTPDRRA
jgi:hypothetical protein